MIHESLNFSPDWASPPGATIAAVLEEKKLPLTAFALHLGYAPELADALLQGQAEITIKVAQRLVELVGGSTAFWMTREAQYRRDLARIHPAVDSKPNSAWLAELPLKDMRSFGWLNLHIDAGNELEACLNFFGVPDISKWRETYSHVFRTASFKRSAAFNSEFGATAAWLRQGELESAAITTKPWNSSRFESALHGIRSLTRRKDPGHFVRELQKVCADAGVAVVVVRAPSGCRASGATRFLSPTKACILLSFRYLSDDHFWFTFFHEAGHLLLHKKDAVFLEDGSASLLQEEKEANEFAARMLIPVEERTNFERLPRNSKAVIKFAQKLGISPGIVVGQMQHCGLLSPSHLNSLKRRFTWGGISLERQ